MYKDEVVENIPEWNLKIIQNNNFFKFGVDTVCLAKFASSFNTKANIVDLCSGSGAVGLIYSRLIDEKIADKPMYTKIDNIIFVEKQEYFVDLNKRNIELNNIKNAKVYCRDIINDDISLDIPRESIDKILCNPPYYLNSLKNNTKHYTVKEKEIAKVEDLNFLDSLFKSSFDILKDNGELYIVHKPERLSDIFIAAEKHSLIPKHLQFVQSKNSNKPTLVLLQFKKNVKRFLKILDNYII